MFATVHVDASGGCVIYLSVRKLKQQFPDRGWPKNDLACQPTFRSVTCNSTCRRSCLKLISDDHLRLRCRFHSMYKTHWPPQSTLRLGLNSTSVQPGYYDLCTLVHTSQRNACNATPTSNYSATPPCKATDPEAPLRMPDSRLE